MGIFNCVICGSEIDIIGKISHLFRKIKCKQCGIVGQQMKKPKDVDIVIINSH